MKKSTIIITILISLVVFLLLVWLFYSTKPREIKYPQESEIKQNQVTQPQKTQKEQTKDLLEKINDNTDVANIEKDLNLIQNEQDNLTNEINKETRGFETELMKEGL
jgi:multidrug efflux pump subunit AcrB